MSAKTNETPRQAYIRLLSEQTKETDSETSQTREAILCSELITENYLEGASLRNETGAVVAADILGVTVKGRLFLQELEKQEREETFWGRYGKVLLVAGGWIAGSLSPILTKLAEKHFGI